MTIKYALLQIANYPGYPHYYGKLSYRDVDGKKVRIEITHVLTAGEAKSLSTNDYHYHEGWTSNRFSSFEDLWKETQKLIPENIEVVFDDYGIPAYIFWHKDEAKMIAANEVYHRWIPFAEKRSTPDSVLNDFTDEWAAVLGVNWRKLRIP